MTEFRQSNPLATDDPASVPTASRLVNCWVSFGGNVGDVKATFDAALALLSFHCDILIGQRSGIYCTSAMGSQAGSPFLNSICGLTTLLSAKELLGVLQSVETQLGRVRDLRWGPRTLDLDLLSYGNQFVFEPDLIVPHPGLAYRRFVLDPLVEIDPHWCHPGCSVSACQLLKRLHFRPLRVSLLDVAPHEIETLATQLSPHFPHLQLVFDPQDSEELLRIRTESASNEFHGATVDLRRSPGDILEKLTSAFTAIFDVPERVSAW